ncbi:MAG: nicotinate-nucleotide adenylyltransferase [Bacteroidetes bacterium]|nr:nicotinate-nucleotide adenylyltransferase [Bacteroidota bacterium]
MQTKIAVVHGRFQPLHNGHLNDYILKTWKESGCDYMYIGITNADIFHTRDNKADPQRSLPESNPLSFIERLEIIKQAILDSGISLAQFDIVPFPINIPDLLPAFIPENAEYFLTVFDAWGEEKVKILKEVYGDSKVKVLFRKSQLEKQISSTLVRRMIRDNGPWESLVPKAVADYLKQKNIIGRIKETQKT